MGYDVFVVELLILVHHPPSTYLSMHAYYDLNRMSRCLALLLSDPFEAALKGRYSLCNAGVGLCIWFVPVALVTC